MKSSLHILRFSALLVALPMAPLSAANLVTNGDFEAGATADQTYTFASTPGWYNAGAGLKQNLNARTDGLRQPPSKYSALITDRYAVTEATTAFSREHFGPSVHAQKTKHTIRAGEAFSLTYAWASGYKWNLDTDEVRFVLFATKNDTLGGPVVWSAVLDSGASGPPAETWKTVTGTTDAADAAAAGRVLFVAFYGFQNNGAMSPQPGFGRVDNIVVEGVLK